MQKLPTAPITQEELAFKSFYQLEASQALALLMAICEFANMPQLPSAIKDNREAIFARYNKVKDWGLMDLHRAIEDGDTSL